VTSTPDIGSIWRSSTTGNSYRVLHVDDQKIVLQSDTQTIKMPLYQWPADMSPVIDAIGPSEGLKALVVGGSEGRHFERLWDQAADLGVDLAYHWNGQLKRIPSSLPADINLVIILVSHIGHPQQNAVKLMTKGVVPVAYVPSGGFKPSLQTEMKKLGFEQFGAARARPRSRGHYSWTGRSYIWREHGAYSDREVPAAGVQEPLLGAIVMALLGLLFGRTS